MLIYFQIELYQIDTHIVLALNRLPNEMSQNMFGWSCSLPLYAALIGCSRTLQPLSINAADAVYITSYALCGGSLMTMAISVDRPPALLLGLRYKQTVTLKRIYVIVATSWVLFSTAALCYFIQTYIFYWLVPTGLFKVNVKSQN